MSTILRFLVCFLIGATFGHLAGTFSAAYGLPIVFSLVVAMLATFGVSRLLFPVK